MRHLNTTLTAAALTAAALTLAAPATATPTTRHPIPAHTCNVSVQRTHAGITYTAPAHKDTRGHYNACTLTRGMTGAPITAMQRALNTYRAPGTKRITTFGYYGPTTRANVAAFQRAYGLPASGTLDTTTSSALLEPLGILN